ncbi:MAG: FAD-binding protein [Silicimonas sp.]|nr:FAD-binding protein [Silicimonas sp.]
MNPTSEAELAEAIATAKGPLRIQGGGTRPIGNPVEGEALTTSGLSGITLYEPGALTIVAHAGTPMTEIEAALDAENQMLPFEPMDHRALLGTDGTPTIGGVVAANVSGPRRVQAGACRDSLIGVRFVNGEGTVIKNGGRVMKNVTGYDLVKLMAGSYGTLGVVSEVSFKVLPKPDTASVLLINNLTLEDGVKAMAKALSSPYEVSGAAHTPSGIDGHPVTMLRLEGFENSVAYRADELKKLLQAYGDILVESDPERTRAGWKWVRDGEAFAGFEGDIWRFSIKPSDAPALLEHLAETAGEEIRSLLDWGGGLVWVGCPAGKDLRQGIPSGHATLVSAKTVGVPVFHPEAAPLAKLASDLRAQFDPKGILNPGLMG